ncbi:serine/threonine-protein kinase [Actinomadura alba]|uniref:serine/threonine-protein kinase n=1 Tax=Actinomadura alba TaxID=406431 RepID=UPI001C9C5A32|nr:serine/threonine-protein kinase [Actinomadura alba]
MNEWRLPGFSELRELGAGGQGRVVLARHDRSGTLVAVKYLAPGLAGDQRFVELFRNEARMLARVTDPHVARLHEFVVTEQGSAIVMEAVDGVSLREVLRRHGRLAPEAALTVLKGSLLGLAAAHALGVVHRDYKPANVLVRGDGQSRLVDFGVAAHTGAAGLRTGTPAYMAPEQWRGEAAAPATDVYAATCVFFECMTGDRPYRGDGAALMAQHTTAPVPLAALPEPLRPLVHRGMAKEPGSRPAGAAAFVTELEAAAVAAYGPGWEHRGVRSLAVASAALAVLFPLSVLVSTSAGTGGGVAGAAGMAGQATGKAAVAKGLLAGTAGKVTAAVAGAVIVVAAGGAAVRAVRDDRPAPVRSTPVVAAAPIDVRIDDVDRTTTRRQYVTVGGHSDPAVQQKINAALRAPVDEEIAAYVRQFGEGTDVPTGTATIGLLSARLLSVSYGFGVDPGDEATGNWVKNFTSTRSVTVDLTTGDGLGARDLFQPGVLSTSGLAALSRRVMAAPDLSPPQCLEEGPDAALRLTAEDLVSADPERRSVEPLLRPGALVLDLDLSGGNHSQACRVVTATLPHDRLAEVLRPQILQQVRSVRPTATTSPSGPTS